jgi:hypothetical protein
MGFLISLWPLWLGGIGLIIYWWFFVREKTLHGYSGQMVTLMLEIPRANEKKELAAEQMFASLHGILRSKKEIVRDGILQEHMSFEIASIEKRIRFFVTVPKHLQNFVEGQIYAQYPTVQIYEVPDYTTAEITQPVTMTSELTLTDNEVLPIKTFQSFEVDPLAAITATLAKLEDENEQMWIQVLARPVDDNWHKKSSKYVKRIKEGSSVLSGGGFLSYMGQVAWALFQPPEESAREKTRDISERDKSRISAIEEKSKKLGYNIKIRIVYQGPDKATARLRMQAMVGTFKQFNTTNLNGFSQKRVTYDAVGVAEYQARHFIEKGNILNIEELASVFHLPHTNVETPNILWATAKTAEPPANLPAVGKVDQQELSPFGTTNFRGTNIQFGLKRRDRARHLYIIGQTGVGKSGLLELLTLSDIYSGDGFAVIDPHGDYAQHVIDFIPAHRVEDVIYFNPADREFPIGFNPLEVTDPNMKNHISSELVGVLKRMFDSWGPRLEYILRYTILALLDYPNATMLDITRMLTEKDFRKDVISHVTDPVVKNFWTVEFASWNDKFASEAVAPVLNKVGAFTANPMIRNIVGQKQSTMNIRSAMDNGKILIVNLSRGLVGEDNAAILGALMVTKIQLAAMSRADIPNIEDRRPFYLYVDEFQNFATDSFATILSEARKYALNLTVANQYTSQMEPTVRDAVFGNVGGIISFRVGAEDAAALTKYFEPQFEAQDILQLHNRTFVASLSIDGEKAPAFSATTLNLPESQTNYTQSIIENSRLLYAVPRLEVEQSIHISTAPKFTQPSQQGSQKRSDKTEHNKNTNDRGSNQSNKGSRSSSGGKKSKSKSKANNKKNDQKAEIKIERDKNKSQGTFENDETISLR